MFPVQRAPWWPSCDVHSFLQYHCAGCFLLSARTLACVRQVRLCLARPFPRTPCTYAPAWELGLVQKTKLTGALEASCCQSAGVSSWWRHRCRLQHLMWGGRDRTAAMARKGWCWWRVSSGCAPPPSPCGLLWIGNALPHFCACLLNLITHPSQQLYKLLDVLLMHPVSLKI